MSVKRLAVVGAVLASLMLVPSTASGALSGAAAAAKLRNAISVEGMMRHERAFQRIANNHDGTRVAGTSGYNASANYVVRQLKKAGYDPHRQWFDFPFFEELDPPVFERTAPSMKPYVELTDFATMQYSGSGEVTANVQEVDNQFPPGTEPSSSNAGCEDADFAGFTAGNVALIQRGTCFFEDKALNAQEAGASAVIIFNEGQPGRTDVIIGTLGGPNFTIPVIGASFAVAEELHTLLGSGPVTVHIDTSTVSEIRRTANVLATTGGRADRLVIQGSHLDSVPAGPGIQDNGSGSAYNLEAAIQLAKRDIEPRNRVRFAWWGAEEQGLFGSQHYVDSLSDAKFSKIFLNLNFDMIASPNFVRFVYDGDGSDTPDAGPPGSAEIEQVFLDYFDSQGLATDPTAFDGRSDYGPFIARGAPAGGLFTGAEVIKTPEQAAIYGGTAGVAYDPCYHQPCDTIDNVNKTALNQMSDAGATALGTFAFFRGPLAAPVTVTPRVAHARAAMSEWRGGRLQR